MEKKVQALVLAGYGINCDRETAYALELAGAEAHRVHINELVGWDGRPRTHLDEFQILVFDGGFSWGDDHGAGVILATRLGTHLGEEIRRFIREGKLVLGICNGFQAMVNMGLLPGLDGDYASREVGLTWNDCGNFQDRWVHLAVNPDSPCVFTRGMDRMELPVRHGEGKLVAAETVLDALETGSQIVCRYAMPDGSPAGTRFPENPNGSMRDIAGICDSSGRVFGLMPHPEAYNHWTNHPDWTFRKASGTASTSSDGAGIQVFRNAVEYIRSGL